VRLSLAVHLEIGQPGRSGANTWERACLYETLMLPLLLTGVAHGGEAFEAAHLAGVFVLDVVRLALHREAPDRVIRLAHGQATASRAELVPVRV
jgi:hypothetical protein